ncbi:MAG: hypothetical protein ACI38Y_00905 [Candidatus Methanomethylophilaceae archaeon]
MHDPTHLYEGDITPGTERLAKVISALSYPPFLSAVVFVLLSLTADTVSMAVISMVIAVMTSLVIPFTAIIYYSRKFGNGDGDISRREDRVRPFLVGISSYFLGVVLLYSVGAPWVCTVTMMSYATSTVIVMLISTKWKISVHATGLMGPTVLLAMVYDPVLAVLSLSIIPVAWSRYVRRKHTPLQLIAGALFGTVYTAVFLTLFL